MTVDSILTQKGLTRAGIDTTTKTERDSCIFMLPDSSVSVSSAGCSTEYDQGMFIGISLRHNGSYEDKVKAFEDAIKLVNSIIFNKTEDGQWKTLIM